MPSISPRTRLIHRPRPAIQRGVAHWPAGLLSLLHIRQPGIRHGCAIHKTGDRLALRIHRSSHSEQLSIDQDIKRAIGPIRTERNRDKTRLFLTMVLMAEHRGAFGAVPRFSLHASGACSLPLFEVRPLGWTAAERCAHQSAVAITLHAHGAHQLLDRRFVAIPLLALSCFRVLPFGQATLSEAHWLCPPPSLMEPVAAEPSLPALSVSPHPARVRDGDRHPPTDRPARDILPQ